VLNAYNELGHWDASVRDPWRPWKFPDATLAQAKMDPDSLSLYGTALQI
jgi:hypothetical protein